MPETTHAEIYSTSGAQSQLFACQIPLLSGSPAEAGMLPGSLNIGPPGVWGYRDNSQTKGSAIAVLVTHRGGPGRDFNYDDEG